MEREWPKELLDDATAEDIPGCGANEIETNSVELAFPAAIQH